MPTRGLSREFKQVMNLLEKCFSSLEEIYIEVPEEVVPHLKEHEAQLDKTARLSVLQFFYLGSKIL